MTDIWNGSGIWSGWKLTTDHPSSSYGQPVLVDPQGNPYGPGDITPVDYVGQKEIAELLGWSKQQVSNYYNSGRLPIPDQIVSGRPLWDRNKIEHYRDSRLP